MHRGKRGPYRPWGRIETGAGAFIRERRIKRGMTQARYAKFIGVGLRTLIEAEKDTRDRLPWGVMFWSLAKFEFANESEMSREFDAFKKEKAR